MSRSIRATLCILLMTAGSGEALAMTFKIATLAPAGTTWMKEVKKGARAITEKTDGRVRFKFYPAGVMGSDAIVLRKIRAGQLHGGAFSSAGLARLYPDIQALNIPMLFNGFDEVDYVRARVEPVMKEQMLKKGFVLLGIAENGFTNILSQSPIDDLESIRASRLWVPEGDVMAKEILLSMDLSPVSLPISDVFAGLQTGLIETVMVTPTAAIAMQWHDGAAYLIDTPLAYLVGFLAIQKRAFDKLSAEDRQIVEQEIDKAFDEMDRLTRIDNINALQALENQGIQLVEPKAAELARWKRLSKRSVDSLIARGALTREGVDRVMHYLEHYRSLRAQNGGETR